MKVLFVSAFYDPDNVGGAEIALRQLVHALRDRGHEIAILCTSRDGRSSDEIREGILVRRAPMPNDYWHGDGAQRSAWRRLFWHLKDIYNRDTCAIVADTIDQVRPDLVCTENLAGLSISVWDAARAAGVPLVHVLNDLYLLAPSHRSYESAWRRPLAYAFRIPHRRSSAHVDGVVALSPGVLQKHVRAGYFRGAARFVVPTALAIGDPGPAPYAAASASLRIGFLGRLVPGKGIGLLLRAFSALPSLNAHLFVAGDGAAAYVENLRRRYANARVSFLGRVTPDDFFPRIDICIVPSTVYDTLPNVAIEACAYRVPVIGSRVGGIPEIIRDGENGFLFSLTSRADMMRALQFACDHRARLASMRDSAREAVAPFLDCERQLAQYEEAFAAVVGRTRRAADG